MAVQVRQAIRIVAAEVAVQPKQETLMAKVRAAMAFLRQSTVQQRHALVVVVAVDLAAQA
jgi:hypothetical protein